MKVFIAGQKYFGAEVLKLCVEQGVEVVGVMAPEGDKRLRAEAKSRNIKVISPGLIDESLIKLADIGICAHYFGIIPVKALLAPKLGWIGYHPSLLPRHKGRSSIEWTIRMQDNIAGGTIYWLNSEVDGGDILCQRHCFVDAKLFGMDIKEASGILWRDKLSPLGLELFKEALKAIETGYKPYLKQEKRFETIEPYIR